MSTVYVFLAIAALLWLLSLACCAVAFLYSCFPARLPFWLATALSGLAIVLGYLGTMHFHVSYSRTVNGSGWSLDTRWFFVVPLVLGVAAFAAVIWRYSRSSPPSSRS